MDWTKGFAASYYMTIVDADTWEDVETIEIINASISRSDSNLIESADIECVKYNRGERWIRLWLDARQEGSDTQHVAMFTGLATSPSENINGIIVGNKLECYSVLKPADDVILPLGYFVPKKTNIANLIKNYLLSDTPAPVVIDGDPPTISKTLIAEDGETKLSMAIKLLTAINWRYRIDGYGIIHLCPKNTDPLILLDALEMDVVEPQLEIQYDWFRCPNVFVAIIDGASYTARDDDPNSMLSTIQRKREIWFVEKNPVLNSGETATQYVKRRLKEEQTTIMEVSYNRRFYPNITVGDRISMNFPAQNVIGTFEIKSNSFDLNYGATVSEKSNKISDSILGE